MDYRIEQLRYQLREDPSSRLFFQLGEILRRDGQLEEAVEVLEHGLERHPRYVAAWMALGKTLRDRGDSLAAEQAFSRALELDPENQAAARLIGESAIDRAEWTRAVKALKLARALGLRDDELDEQIEMVEGKLSALGLLEVPGPAPLPRPAREEPPAAEPSPPAASHPTSRSVVALFDDDPFAVTSNDDTGVWSSPEDPFSADIPSPSPEPADRQATMPIPRSEIAAALDAGNAPDEEPVAAVDTHESMVVEPDDDDDEMPDPAMTPDIETVALTAETITLPPRPVTPDADPTFPNEPFDAAPDEAYDDAPDDERLEETPADEVPVPTLTLARLALSQGDVELAERTLHGLLERVPDSVEAAQLLDELGHRRAGEATPATTPAAVAKVVALQRWLEAIRLAAERRTL